MKRTIYIDAMAVPIIHDGGIMGQDQERKAKMSWSIIQEVRWSSFSVYANTQVRRKSLAVGLINLNNLRRKLTCARLVYIFTV